MEFGIKKYGIVKRDKAANGQMMKQVGLEGHPYLAMTELDKIKET